MLTRALTLLLTASMAMACSSDSGGALPDVVDDAVAEDTGPSDDASRIEIVIPDGRRAFDMAMSAPFDGEGTAWFDASWAELEGRADVVTVVLDAGLPWEEIVSGDPWPAEFEAQVQRILDQVDAANLPLMLIVDPLNDARDGFRRDLLGRTTVTPSFGDQSFSDAYTSFLEALVLRTTPTYFAPVIGLDRYVTANSEQLEAAQSWFIDSQRVIKRARAVLYFPIWNYWAVTDAVAEQNTTILALLDNLDQVQDFFAISLYPAVEGARLSDLSVESFAPLDASDREATNPVTTRPLAIVNASFPAEGFTLGGVTYPSSENSQFNFLALLFQVADEREVELVGWRMPVDPDAWLADPCGVDVGCDEEGLAARYVRFRSNGLLNELLQPRAALDLWDQYHQRDRL